tara:strand:- start:871 stop:1242 length:372 start_codon:yes stop_codon:yes gene_type:complete
MTILEGLKVLIVDDEPDLRELLAEEFELEGANVDTAADGEEAFEMIKENNYKLVLSDVRMAPGDGISLLENVNQWSDNGPHFFFITGFADISRDEAISKGAKEVFSKPIDLDDLLSQIVKLLS